MRLAPLMLLVLPGISGCFLQASAGLTGARGALRGGTAEVVVGDAGWRIAADLWGGALKRDNGSGTGGGGVDESLRVSPLGFITDTAQWARWVDFGGDMGVGIGGAGPGVIGRAYVGGWMDVRFLPREDEYPTLRVWLHQIGYVGGIADETELMIGVGWTARDPHFSLGMIH